MQLREKSLLEKAEKRVKYQKIISFAISVVTAFAASTTLFMFPSTGKLDFSFDKNIKAISIDNQDRIEMSDKIKSIESYKLQIENELAEIKKYPSESKIAARINRLDISISDIDKRIKGIEGVVMQTPTKALELPMLRKDLESYKETSQVENIALRHELERVYDFNKWFLGLMFTMFVSIFGLSIANFLNFRSPNKYKSEQ